MTTATLRQLVTIDGLPCTVIAARLHPEARPPYHQPRTDGLHLRPTPEHGQILVRSKDRRVRGPNGRTLCCWCWAEVPPRRVCWCSDECVREYRLNHDWKVCRGECRRRDRGVCRLCGVDVEWLHAAWKASRPGMAHRDWLKFGRLLSGLADTCRDWWEADHIQARADGGPDHPDNLRLLCIPCHRRRTRLQAAERAARRRAAKAQETAMTTAPASAPPPPPLIAGRQMPGCRLAAEWLLEVRCDPVGQPRARHRVAGKGRKQFVQTYTPDTADAMKAAIREAAAVRLDQTALPMPWPAAARVQWVAYFPREGHAAERRAPEGAFPHVVKPDKDNVEKAILDALTDAGVWIDDTRVFSVSGDKLWAARGSGPGLRIWVEFIEVPCMPKPAKKKGATT